MPPTGKPDKALTQEVEAAALAQFQGPRDALPEGAQAGLKEFGANAKKVIKAVAPGVIKGVFVAGLDGSFTPEEIAGLVADATRRILLASKADDPASPTDAPTAA